MTQLSYAKIFILSKRDLSRKRGGNSFSGRQTRRGKKDNREKKIEA
jgi:hypothetical protein